MPAHAAELGWQAPEDCPARASVVARIERLIGRPLAAVDAIDFAVRIEREQRRKWRLALTTRSRDHRSLPRDRELVGQTCAEVSEAGAVAIALAISEQAGAGSAAESGAPAAAAPAAEPEPEPAAGRPSQPPTAARLDRASRPEPPPETAEPSESSIEPAAGAGLLLDSGALPSLAPGVTLELSGRYELVRLVLLGAVFPEQEQAATEDVQGGRFQLLLGGLLACLQPSAEGLFALGCAGFELGRISAEGVGPGRSKRGSALWPALRADGGAGYRFSDHAAFVLRLGLTVPLSRGEFSVDAMRNLIHRVPGLTGRALIGIELYP